MPRVTSVLLTLAVGTALCAGPASAGGSGPTPITFETLAPCSVVCPYWTDLYNGGQAACQREPLAPPGTWDDVRVTIPDLVGTQPTAAFHVEISPQLDYDLWLCEVVNPGPNEYYRWVDTCCVFPGETCPTLGIFGCAEEIDYCVSATDNTCLAPGTQIVFRAYNWFDVSSCPGSYEFYS